MAKESFKTLFNFYFNIFLIVSIFFMTLVWADSNGIWHNSGDIRGGTFGSDEQDATVNYTFINPLSLQSNVTYLGIELDTRYLNEGQTNSITSGMIADGQVNGDDVADGSLTGTDIADGTINSSDIAEASIRGANIANGTIGSSHINQSQVQARITGICPVGEFMRGVGSDGSVICSEDQQSTSSGSGGSSTGDPCYVDGNSYPDGTYIRGNCQEYICVDGTAVPQTADWCGD